MYRGYFIQGDTVVIPETSGSSSAADMGTTDTCETQQMSKQPSRDAYKVGLMHCNALYRHGIDILIQPPESDYVPNCQTVLLF